MTRLALKYALVVAFTLTLIIWGVNRCDSGVRFTEPKAGDKLTVQGYEVVFVGLCPLDGGDGIYDAKLNGQTVHVWQDAKSPIINKIARANHK